MKFYADVILPLLMDRSLDGAVIVPYRRAALSGVRGEILEIGFGTGLNLPHYPSQVRTLTALDVSPGMSKLARRRIVASSIAVDHRVVNGEQLPFDRDLFDSVVSTFTLCSIGDVHQALREIRRVLKPGGRFLFVEHGLSDDRQVRAWQHRLTPLHKIVAGGCHLNRDIQVLIAGVGFEIVRIERSHVDKLPRVSGYLYRGMATA